MTSQPSNTSGERGSRPPRKPRHAGGSRQRNVSANFRTSREGQRRFPAARDSQPREVREVREPRVIGPEIDEDVDWRDLDKEVKTRLRTLSKENAEGVGGHLIMAGRLIDTEPELAYEHAKAAVRRAGRVDVVREALALTAYATERYQEALHELRTVRRLNGSSEHLALMADCERGLGRPERAIALSQTPEAETLSGPAKVELAIVVSGARADLGEAEVGLIMLERINTAKLPVEYRIRIQEGQNYLRELLGKPLIEVDEIPDENPEDQDFVVHNLSWGIDDTPDVTEETAASQDTGGSAGVEATAASEARQDVEEPEA